MRRLWLVVGLIGIWWWWRGDTATSDGGVPQAAVLRDGFALRLDGGRVLVLDRKGERRAEHRVRHDGDVRVVGTRSGAAAAWVDHKTIRLVDVGSGKTRGVWGKSVRKLCEGVATNDERFAVGWLESDDTVWFVHGDTGVATTSETMPDDTVQLATVDPKQWCGIASAEANIALFWRDRDRLFINTCTRKKCSSLSAAVAFDRKATLLGFGCLKNACLIAARDPNGKARLSYITESGGVKWTKPLAITSRVVSIVGAGDRAFAFGYATDSGAEVLRVDRGGATSRVWHSTNTGVPVVAWSHDQLLVGHHDQPSLVPFPR